MANVFKILKWQYICAALWQFCQLSFTTSLCLRVDSVCNVYNLSASHLIAPRSPFVYAHENFWIQGCERWELTPVSKTFLALILVIFFIDLWISNFETTVLAIFWLPLVTTTSPTDGIMSKRMEKPRKSFWMNLLLNYNSNSTYFHLLGYNQLSRCHINDSITDLLFFFAPGSM